MVTFTLSPLGCADVSRELAHGDWQIVHALPGRIRVRSARLRGQSERADLLADQLTQTPGVHRVQASARTGSLLVYFNSTALSAKQIVAALDEALDRMLEIDSRSERASTPVPAWELTQLALAGGTLAEFATIAAAPPTAFLLAGALAPTVATACQELARGRVGSPLVSTVIMASTLATGNYFTAAVLAWFLRAWERKYADGVEQVRRRADLRARIYPGMDTSGFAREQIAATLDRTIEAACDAQNQQGVRFADATAIPTLAVAGIGLVTADLGTAAATLRPDYKTTPRRSGGLGFARLADECLRAGALVCDPTAFERIAATSAVVFDAATARGIAADPHTTDLCGRFRTEFNLRIGLLGTVDELIAAELSGRFQADFVIAAENADEAAFELQRLYQQGHRMAVVGQAETVAAVTEWAHAAIQVGAGEEPEYSAAHVLLMPMRGIEPAVQGIDQLWRLAHRQRRDVRGSQWTIAAANVGCVAGAFAFGFTSLHVVLLTNLANWGVYRWGTRSVSSRQPARQIDARWDVPSTRAAVVEAARRLATRVGRLPGVPAEALEDEALPVALAI